MEKSTIVRTVFILCSSTLIAFAQSSCISKTNAETDENISLACPFDKNLYAAKGAKNPYSASGNVSIVKYGKNGVAKFAGHDSVKGLPRLPQDKSALIFDGKNIPPKGSLSFKVRWAGARNWKDGKRTWLAALVPKALAEDEKLGEKGTALVLFKEKDNTLELAAYHTKKNRKNIFRTKKSRFDTGEPDEILMKIPCGAFPSDKWEKVRIAWDVSRNKVWLTAGGETKSASCNILSPDFRCLLIGSCPKTSQTAQRGFDGEIDELIVENSTPDENMSSAMEFPDGISSVEEMKVEMPEAEFLCDTPEEKRLEQYVRAHAQNMIDAQKVGGWAFAVSLPSKMRFLSSKRTIPMQDDYVSCSKQQNSAGAAVRLLAVYEALGDKKYLEAAKKTGDMLLDIQDRIGNWIYFARFDPKTGKNKWIYRPDLAPFEDHAQSHPVILMLRLYELTKEQKYKEAAMKGIKFIYNGQNPNGSWSHHYDKKSKCGHACRGEKNAGEINDYTTSDQMKIMLLAYRLTNDPKYLASYLRAADWLVSAFIDNEKIKGWALQYDENNIPIKARHFEPPSVALSEGIDSIPDSLITAYKLTGDRKYVEPLFKWKKWMLANKVHSKVNGKTGWYTNYDWQTGEPIQMCNDKISPADPRSVGDHGYSAQLKKIDRIDKDIKPYIPSPESAKKRLMKNASSPDKKYKWNIEYLLNDFNPQYGTWTYDLGPVGKCFSPPTVRILFLSWALFLNRQLKGQIPWNHPMGQLTMFEWADIFNHVMSPKTLYKKLTPKEMAEARKFIARQK